MLGSLGLIWRPGRFTLVSPMLRALTQRKLALPDEDEGVSRLEDALTATVFERLSYLPAVLAMDILQQACVPLSQSSESVFPILGQAGLTFEFWPRFRHPDGRLVEPDVVIWSGDKALVVEAKHHGEQDQRQWVREIRAVGAESVVGFIAAGGRSPRQDEERAEWVTRNLGAHLPMYQLIWDALYARVEERVLAQPPPERRVLEDLVCGLAAFGYERRPQWGDPLVLPDVHVPGAILQWHLLGRAP